MKALVEPGHRRLTGTRAMMRRIEPHSQLSALWLFVLLNVIFRDIHQLAKKSYLESLLATEISEKLMLVVGFIIEIPIAMVLFSLILARSVLRSLTFFAAFITLMGMVSIPPSDLDDVFFLVVQVLALAAITWTAWQWASDDNASSIPVQAS